MNSDALLFAGIFHFRLLFVQFVLWILCIEILGRSNLKNWEKTNGKRWVVRDKRPELISTQSESDSKTGSKKRSKINIEKEGWKFEKVQPDQIIENELKLKIFDDFKSIWTWKY